MNKHGNIFHFELKNSSVFRAMNEETKETKNSNLQENLILINEFLWFYSNKILSKQKS